MVPKRENNIKLLFIVTFKFYKNVSLSVMIRVIAVIAYNISIGIWNQLIPSATVDKHMLYKQLYIKIHRLQAVYQAFPKTRLDFIFFHWAHNIPKLGFLMMPLHTYKCDMMMMYTPIYNVIFP